MVSHDYVRKALKAVSVLCLFFSLAQFHVCIFYCSTYYKAVRVGGGGLLLLLWLLLLLG